MGLLLFLVVKYNPTDVTPITSANTRRRIWFFDFNLNLPYFLSFSIDITNITSIQKVKSMTRYVIFTRALLRVKPNWATHLPIPVRPVFNNCWTWLQCINRMECMEVE